MTTKTTARAYRDDWHGTHYPLETPYGVVSIQPLGWGFHVESRSGMEYVSGEGRVLVEDPPLRINGRDCRLGLTAFHVDRGLRLELGTTYGGTLTANAEQKMREILPDLVRAWLDEHVAEFVATREAYLSNQARTCEESIRELEDALELYRGRLEQIEAGDLDVSPFLNGGRRLLEA